MVVQCQWECLNAWGLHQNRHMNTPLRKYWSGKISMNQFSFMYSVALTQIVRCLRSFLVSYPLLLLLCQSFTQATMRTKSIMFRHAMPNSSGRCVSDGHVLFVQRLGMVEKVGSSLSMLEAPCYYWKASKQKWHTTIVKGNVNTGILVDAPFLELQMPEQETPHTQAGALLLLLSMHLSHVLARYALMRFYCTEAKFCCRLFPNLIFCHLWYKGNSVNSANKIHDVHWFFHIPTECVPWHYESVALHITPVAAGSFASEHILEIE